MKPNTIEFRDTSSNTWVMRITADKRIEVNEDVDVTFAAQKVLDAMQGLLTPQRQPLSYVDLRRIANQCGLGANKVSARTQATIDNYARAIEAAHGIKGEA